MSEPLNTGIKRIIWIATNSKHQIVSIWYPWYGSPLHEWKSRYKPYAKYITKHEVWL